MKQIIIIDGSYYIFYRYHALCMWWSKARQEDEPLEPVNAPRFIEKFKSSAIRYPTVRPLNPYEPLFPSYKLALRPCQMVQTGI